MTVLPDYSNWLTAERYARETSAWMEAAFYEYYAEQLKTLCEDRKLWSVLELGCGIGLVPTRLDPQKYDYYGVDSNPHVLRRARELNPQFDIYDEDLRNVTPAWLLSKIGQEDVDVVCTFAVLKHFGLHEWLDVFSKMLHCGRHAIFSIPMADRDHDDGTEFHHTWICEATLMKGLEQGCHRLIEPMCPDIETNLDREHIFFSERMETGQ